MAELVAVKVPDIGDFADVPVIEVLVSAGDEVAVEDPLVTLESDKATMDIPPRGPGPWPSSRWKWGTPSPRGR